MKAENQAALSKPLLIGLLREAGLDWLYVGKVLLAIFMGGGLAMRLDLQQPATTMLTVALVMHPASGMVLAKGFYRAVGTLVGCGAAIALVGLFPQQRELLLVGMALWIGLCAAGASLYRNFMSYGFVLSGYTVAIVVLPVVQHPQALFDSAVMRVSEVMLGILVAGLVGDVLFPQRLRMALRQQLSGQYSGFLAFVRGSLGGVLGRDALENAHMRFVGETIQVENLRSSVVFEDAGVRAHSPRLRQLNQRFMEVSTSYQTLHHLMNRMHAPHHHDTRQRLMQLCEFAATALEDDCEPDPAAAARLSQALQKAERELPGKISEQRQGLTSPREQLDFDTGAELLSRCLQELQAYVQAYALLRRPGVPTAAQKEVVFQHGNDHLGALMCGVRATVTMLVMGSFWIMSGWVHGGSAMMLATIFTGMFASAPNPSAVVRQITLGFATGMPLAFLCQFMVLTHMDGFVLMVAGTLPFLLIGLYLTTRPTLAGYGTGFVLSFIYLLNLHSPMTFDPVYVVNEGISQIVGVLAVAVAFSLFGNASSNRWLRNRLLRQLRSQVARACELPLPGLRDRVESATRDLFMQIMVHAGPRARDWLAWALSVHETGRAVVELRRLQASLPDTQQGVVGAVLEAFAALYRSDEGKQESARQRALRALDTAMAAVSDRPALRQLHLLRLALLDTESVLAAPLSPYLSSYQEAATDAP
jgi:uncharacterized membrane protein YccC